MKCKRQLNNGHGINSLKTPKTKFDAVLAFCYICDNQKKLTPNIKRLTDDNNF